MQQLQVTRRRHRRPVDEVAIDLPTEPAADTDDAAELLERIAALLR